MTKKTPRKNVSDDKQKRGYKAVVEGTQPKSLDNSRGLFSAYPVCPNAIQYKYKSCNLVGSLHTIYYHFGVRYCADHRSEP